MSRIVKLDIKNMYGIREYSQGGESVELSGENGVGKTSVIDAIKYALTNKSDREYVVRNGESEGEIIVETDTGLRINRKARTNQADYKSVKQNGVEVNSPEAFLRDIFTPLQLNPIEFMSMDKKRQNAIILDMIEYPWTLETIKGWFGELPDWVSYDQNILSVLNEIQSENGWYFKHRTDVNRDIRNNRAFIEEIAAELPDGYNAAKWENENLSEIYAELERIRKDNQLIQKAKDVIAGRNDKVRAFEAEKEIQTTAVEKEFSSREQQIEKDIISLRNRISELETERAGLEGKKSDKLEIIRQKYNADVAKFEAEVEEYRKYENMELKDTTELQEKASTVEKMKSYINEYKRMLSLQQKIDELTEESNSLTNKIELARTLPGTILETATIPIKGLSVKDGIPLINGLPVSNLSEGEKLDLCIDVAIQKPNALQIILIDGVEKLSTKLKEQLYKKCRDRGLQFIATRTTDEEEMSVVEL